MINLEKGQRISMDKGLSLGLFVNFGASIPA